jgi:hypothetical protein
MSCIAFNNLQFLAQSSLGRFFLGQFLHGEEIIFPPRSKGIHNIFILSGRKFALSIERSAYFNGQNSWRVGTYPATAG